ncbi:MAG: signal peptidase I [Clostridiales bacterium]|nr:signal peptidase I [Clostridiales bacterium]
MRKAITIITGIWNALLLLLALAIVVPRLFGMLPKAVQTPSMEKALPVGSLVYVTPVAFEDIREACIITFQAADGGGFDTHRVESIDHEAKQFITKGDNNPVADPNPVPYERVTGRVYVFVPLVGYLLIWTQPLYGKILAGVVCLASVLTFFILINGNKRKRIAHIAPLIQEENAPQEAPAQEGRAPRWPLPQVQGRAPGTLRLMAVPEELLDKPAAEEPLPELPPPELPSDPHALLSREELLQLVDAQEKEIQSLRQQLESAIAAANTAAEPIAPPEPDLPREETDMERSERFTQILQAELAKLQSGQRKVS